MRETRGTPRVELFLRLQTRSFQNKLNAAYKKLKTKAKKIKEKVMKRIIMILG